MEQNEQPSFFSIHVDGAIRYSLEQLEMFARVVKTGLFSSAARSLGKTQSTISMAIANLEVDITDFSSVGKTHKVNHAKALRLHG